MLIQISTLVIVLYVTAAKSESPVGIVSIQFDMYRQANRDECDPSSMFNKDYCDPYFTISVSGLNGVLGSKKSSVHYEAPGAIQFTNAVGNLPNPIQFPFYKSFFKPNDQLKISVVVKDFDDDKLHDHMVTFQLSQSISNTTLFQNNSFNEGSLQIVKLLKNQHVLNLTVWIQCNPNYYHGGCSVYCDSTEFPCSPDGQQICPSGYFASNGTCLRLSTIINITTKAPAIATTAQPNTISTSAYPTATSHSSDIVRAAGRDDRPVERESQTAKDNPVTLPMVLMIVIVFIVCAMLVVVVAVVVNLRKLSALLPNEGAVQLDNVVLLHGNILSGALPPQADSAQNVDEYDNAEVETPGSQAEASAVRSFNNFAFSPLSFTTTSQSISLSKRTVANGGQSKMIKMPPQLPPPRSIDDASNSPDLDDYLVPRSNK